MAQGLKEVRNGNRRRPIIKYDENAIVVDSEVVLLSLESLSNQEK